MRMVIHLPPEVEQRLREQAARQGQNPEEYVSRLLSAMFGPKEKPFYATATPQEWARAFRDWAASHDTTAPAIPLEALRRENMYEDRGL